MANNKTNPIKCENCVEGYNCMDINPKGCSKFMYEAPSYMFKTESITLGEFSNKIETFLK